MAYATVSDMIGRYGEQELIRLSTPAGEDIETIHAPPIETALRDASDMVDTYLRKRYRVPLDLAPSVIVRTVCTLARYDLQTGEQKTISEDARTERKEALAWLKDIADGKVLLDLAEVIAGDNSYAQMSTRGRTPYGDGPMSSEGSGDPWL